MDPPPPLEDALLCAGATEAGPAAVEDWVVLGAAGGVVAGAGAGAAAAAAGPG